MARGSSIEYLDVIYHIMACGNGRHGILRVSKYLRFWTSGTTAKERGLTVSAKIIKGAKEPCGVST